MELKIKSEIGQLKSVIMSDATSMVDDGPELERIHTKYGNESAVTDYQYHPESGIWSSEKLRTQVQDFQNVLRNAGVEVVIANPVKDAWLQVFTRDPSFVIGDTLYLGTMKHPLRQLEQTGLAEIKALFPNVIELKIPAIEGGDVFVQGKNVFVGMGRQTTEAAVTELSNLIGKQGFECIPIKCDNSVLHLDCRFNIIGEHKAFLSTAGVSTEGISRLEKYFELIPLLEAELATLASNYFVISPTKVVVERRNTRVTKILATAGYEVSELDYSEPIKLWGAFRCTTCPLVRE